MWEQHVLIIDIILMQIQSIDMSRYTIFDFVPYFCYSPVASLTEKFGNKMIYWQTLANLNGHVPNQRAYILMENTL